MKKRQNKFDLIPLNNSFRKNTRCLSSAFILVRVKKKKIILDSVQNVYSIFSVSHNTVKIGISERFLSFSLFTFIYVSIMY